MDFPFHQVYQLDDYNNINKPAVFFGIYRFEDAALLAHHEKNDKLKIFWTGQDAIDNWNVGALRNNITAHKKVCELFNKYRIDCKLVKPTPFLLQQKPQTLGKKIYAYCPSSSPEYHGKKILDELRCAGYEIVIGDGQFTQDQWKNGKADFFYKDIFIGLCLSEFAGGGLSIIEMGLRGINVVTNVFNLPNCIPWNSIHDIRQAIEDQTQYIGHSNPGLANYVWDDLDHKHEWLNI